MKRSSLAIVIALAALLAAVFAGAAGVPGFSRIHLLAKTIVGSGTGGSGTGGTGTGSISPDVVAKMYSSTDPYSPAYQHPYRHGVVPTSSQFDKMLNWAVAHPAASVSSLDVNYHGGIDGIGVTDGPEKVYLVFWGSQWGTQGSSGGYTTLSGDPNGAAPYLQKLFKGLGNSGDTWSGVMTQYCEDVPVGTEICPSTNLEHVGYPYGGALAGVWVDESAAAPAAATEAQIGSEAIDAAAHFGNTTADANRLAQYVILSPTGTDPDHYMENGFCAWHTFNTDVGVTSPYGDIAFTNMPYVTDFGTECQHVNYGTAGLLDPFSIVEGHEYAETITDQDPGGGYYDAAYGYEVGDLCAWNAGPGAHAAYLSLTTGKFAMQGIWGNDGAGGGDCEFSHLIISNNTVTVAGNQRSAKGTAVSLQMSAADTQFGQTLTWSAIGLPAGLSIDASTGLISGTPTTLQTVTVTVTAKDKTGVRGSFTFIWAIRSQVGG